MILKDLVKPLSDVTLANAVQEILDFHKTGILVTPGHTRTLCKEVAALVGDRDSLGLTETCILMEAAERFANKIKILNF